MVPDINAFDPAFIIIRIVDVMAERHRRSGIRVMINGKSEAVHSLRMTRATEAVCQCAERSDLFVVRSMSGPKLERSRRRFEPVCTRKKPVSAGNLAANTEIGKSRVETVGRNGAFGCPEAVNFMLQTHEGGTNLRKFRTFSSIRKNPRRDCTVWLGRKDHSDECQISE